MKRLSNFLRLQPGEVGAVFILGLIMLGNSIALQVSSIVAISGFVGNGGVNKFLLVVLIDYIFILLTSVLQTLIIDRITRAKLVAGIGLGLMSVFLILRLMFAWGAPELLNYAVMYLLAEQQLFTFPLIFWVLANDIFSMEQSKRLFPLISSGSFIGELMGIGVAAAFPTLTEHLPISSADILIFNAFIYFGIFVLISIGLRSMKTRNMVTQHETVRETLSDGWGFVREIDSFRYLMFTILALAACSIIIEFRFLVTSSLSFPNEMEYLQFYSFYRLGLTLACFALQTFFTSRIIANFGLKNTFLLLPVISLLGTLGLFFFPVLSTALVAIFLFMLIRLTIHEASVKSFESLVPEEHRGRVSTFMDGYLPAVGIIGGCLLTGAIVLVGIWQKIDLHIAYLSIAALLAILSTFSALKLRKVYDNSLLNWRLKRRQRSGGSRLNLLVEKLMDKDEPTK
jgi:hypothetical protein